MCGVVQYVEGAGKLQQVLFRKQAVRARRQKPLVGFVEEDDVLTLGGGEKGRRLIPPHFVRILPHLNVAENCGTKRAIMEHPHSTRFTKLQYNNEKENVYKKTKAAAAMHAELLQLLVQIQTERPTSQQSPLLLSPGRDEKL